MKTFTRILYVAAAILLSVQLSFAIVTTVAVSPAGPTVNLPQQFTLNVTVSTDSVIHGAEISLRFDHNILQYNSVSLGSFLPGAFSPSTLVTVGAQYDVVRIAQVLLSAGGNSGSGTLLTFSFTAKAVGTTTITLPLVDLRTVAVSGTPTACSVVTGNVTVDPPLPITLVSFKASVTVDNYPTLYWKTISEIENYGFMIQRRSNGEGEFADIPNSFVEGHGTTTDTHEYTYTDQSAGVGDWYYRLKQMDLSGDVHYSDAVQVSVVTSVEEQALPTVFALEQNYPNPFNPKTGVRFQVPGVSDVRLVVYDQLGREVAVLVNEVKQPGRYEVSFDGAGLASGMYVYRLTAGSFVQARTMVLVK